MLRVFLLMAQVLRVYIQCWLLLSSLFSFDVAADLSASAVALHASDSQVSRYPRTLSFRNIFQHQDIIVGSVEAIAQDHEGFIWIGGSSALLRYDGYEFLSIKTVENVQDLSRTSPVSQVVKIVEDSRHQMWVSTRVGFFKYDRQREVLVRVKLNMGDKILTFGDTVNAIAEMPSGEIIVGNTAGLTQIDVNGVAKKIEITQPSDAEALLRVRVNDVVVDKIGIVWLATDGGITRLDWHTKKINYFIPDPQHPRAGPTNALTTMAMDAEGNLWAGAFVGLYRFNTATGAFTLYQHNPQDAFSVVKNAIFRVYVDDVGVVWIGSDGGGLCRYDAVSNQFIRYERQEGASGALSSNSIRTILRDRNGDLWVGNYPAGAHVHDSSTDAIRVYQHGADINRGLVEDGVGTVLEDAEGNLWIGAGAMTRLNPRDGTMTHYRENQARRFQSSAPISSYIDSSGDLWVGTWVNGLQHYNAQTDAFDAVPSDPSLAHAGLQTGNTLIDNTVWRIYEDKHNTFWIAMHNAGLAKWNRATGQYTFYAADSNNPHALSSPLVWNMMEDSQGRFWIGTAFGLNLMDRDTGTFKHYVPTLNDPKALSSGSVVAMLEDKKGRIWIATDGGLHWYHPETDDFTVFTTRDGFAENTIRSLVEDHHGNLWMGTLSGITEFNPDTKKVKNFTRYNGEQIGGVHIGVGLLTRKGEVVFGTDTGLYVFDVDKLENNTNEPPVVLTDFRIFTEKVPVGGEGNILSSVINQTQQITLDYTQSMISFSFAALNYRDPEKNQFAYKLEGFDDKWRELGNQRGAVYTNLDAGIYTLRVRASNNDGVWNNEGKSLRIIQLPPPWKTWWAFTFYACVILAIIALFIHSQRKKRRLVEQQNRLLEIKVGERTAELQEKNHDIQLMLSNMRQGLFTVESNGNIHPAYSRYLEIIFQTKQIAGVSAFELLFGMATCGRDKLSQVRVSMVAILGENQINYDFNAHLLPKEYQTVIEKKQKVLSLDWNPIVVNGLVVRLMVSVRDLTLLKQMENEAQVKTRELEIISQLLNVPAKKYRSFVLSSRRFLEESAKQIKSNERPTDSLIALLFRNMHTIKGNSRTLGFHLLSDLVHGIETNYVALKSSPQIDWDSDNLLNELARVKSLLDEYDYVYTTLLGRGKNTDRNQGLWLDAQLIEKMQGSIDSVAQRLQQFPVLNDERLLSPIQTLFNSVQSSPLSELLAEAVASLATIAPALEKEVPRVFIDDNHVRIKFSEMELIANIFSHILHNCVDHGIEIPAVRLAKGKPAAGTIRISVSAAADGIYIRVSDDGQGIDIKRLFQKGVESAHWRADDSPTYQTIAEFIFESGISTKEHISQLSGRGVGMDAVKQFLLAQGGRIQLQLPEGSRRFSQEDAEIKMPFELLISLPNNAFFVE